MKSHELPTPGTSAKSLRKDFQRYFLRTLGRDDFATAPRDVFTAFALTVRDRLTPNWTQTNNAQSGQRQVCYLSMEFLLGRMLHNALVNLDAVESADKALSRLGLALSDVEDLEQDAGLGNGGLGRLAACFLDSAATLGLPVTGYGLRYHYGMFKQRLQDGYQVEEPDAWLRDGHPWELERAELTQRVQFGGRSEFYVDDRGESRTRWVSTHDVLAIPYDLPVPGYANNTVNTLRLWSAHATDAFDLDEFNAGSYPEAVSAKNSAENITMVLYPNDASENGRELRLRQQFFLASASLQDTLHRWTAGHGERFEEFAAYHCFQLNDTHPSIAIAELMRLLMDEYHLDWDGAWQITRTTTAYTNHTLLPEALERWPVRMLGELLPRHLEIIFEINARFLGEVARRWPGDVTRQRQMSIIEEGDEPMVRMAFLAVVASFSVNGVAALHSQLLCEGLFKNFADLWPARFNNKTNGVTPRRWLLACNPSLAALITETIGSSWRMDLQQLEGLAPFAEDASFAERWRRVRSDNKVALAQHIEQECGVRFDPGAMFEAQVKRIHEYKRQLLSVLHTIHLYARIKSGNTAGLVPRGVLIAGKAAPGYVMAKRIVKLVNNVAAVINADPAARDWLRVAFLPNFRVTSMERITPAVDLSVQISTAGKEASGTGNMKLMMNGSVTIGTLDGANIEIREAVGEDKFFTFGLTAKQVEERRANYDPQRIVAADPHLAEVMDLLKCGHFSQFEPGVLDPIVDAILDPGDPWLVAADFTDYVRAQVDAGTAFADPVRWSALGIANTAASGRFSSDRTIADYNDDIWHLRSANSGEQFS
ncbi:MAG: glycogen/starch/alpha-glucan phosphorylase [Chromatiales bacterium]|jgi:glycogen phosphorylase|nr:glycogen/starch/alpha-glucan phosphorylase [Chromatiales bacterium]